MKRKRKKREGKRKENNGKKKKEKKRKEMKRKKRKVRKRKGTVYSSIEQGGWPRVYLFQVDERLQIIEYLYIRL